MENTYRILAGKPRNAGVGERFFLVYFIMLFQVLSFLRVASNVRIVRE
jgi:hypothetical protein